MKPVFYVNIRVIFQQGTHSDSLESRTWLHIMTQSEVISLFVFFLLFVITQRRHHFHESRLDIHKHHAALKRVILYKTFLQRILRDILYLYIYRSINIVTIHRIDILIRRHWHPEVTVDTSNQLLSITAFQAFIIRTFETYENILFLSNITDSTCSQLTIRQFSHITSLRYEAAFVLSRSEDRKFLHPFVISHADFIGYLYITFPFCTSIFKI